MEKTMTAVHEWKIKHNLTHHPFYITWCNVKARCYNPNAVNYKYYGGRGIKMFEEWIEDSEAFINYICLLPNATTGQTIDRIDNDGDYEPGNLKWSSWMEQSKNKRLVPLGKLGQRYIQLNRGMYAVIKQVNGKKRCFGRYNTLDEAIECRDKIIEL